MKKFITILIGFLLLSFSAFAASAQISVPGKNIPNEENVSGVRLSLLHGETAIVKGLDISVLGLSDMDNFTGLELGLFFGANRVKNEFKGLSLGLVNWHEGYDKGANLGFVNYVNDVNGVNFAFANYSTGDSMINLASVNYVEYDSMVNFGFVNITQGTSLVDVGVINYAEATSFQFGIVNATKALDGLQIGFVNYAENGVFPVLPIVNFKKSL
ncbi:VC2662 family protein [Ilyobacter polytropus]|uniref:PhaC PHA synthase n=1 Tax=Ilyobacter polytropus (strain ATCC 51220 / DSM 2926 / LMG 16218 / CuHBu1) TaxID=572544 RepID=E3HAX3_ILYPC|nr:hypothetical protein [Ilyobacter polytropus]ADO82122.1 conserved hypothetical protein [Ilyobacter polytropus DSM 2926]